MSIAFDTLKLADRLQSAGFSAEQARGTATALSEALTQDLATKADLAGVNAALRADIAETRSELKSDIAVLKWMVGFVLAIAVTVFIKVSLH